MKNKYLLISSLLALFACKTITTVEPVEALLVDMNEDIKLQITKIVSDSMAGKSVRIADSVFSADSRMSVATNMTTTFEGNPINGRVTERPQHYQLMLRGQDCYILHEETGAEYPLLDVACKSL